MAYNKGMEAEGFVPPEALAEAKTEKESLPRELFDVLEKTQSEPGYTPDRDRQRSVLENLPRDLVGQLRGHIYAAARENEFFQNLRGEPGAPPDNGKTIRGELFEILAENDAGLGQFELRKPDQATQEMLALMHDPARFNLGGQLGHFRNPDLTTINRTGDGRVVISRIGEAKLGTINQRANSQIFEGGLRKGVAAAVEVLNGQKDNLEQLSLSGIADLRQQVVTRLAQKYGVKEGKFARADFLEVAENMEQILIVPANRNVNRPETLFNKNILKGVAGADDRERAKNLLENNRTAVVQAAFSVNEVAALADFLLSKINEIEKDNPAFSSPSQSTEKAKPTLYYS